MMKKRMTALALSLAMLAALCVSAASAEDGGASAAPAAADTVADAAPAAPQNAENAAPAATETDRADEAQAEAQPPAVPAEPAADPSGSLAFTSVRSRMLSGFYPLRALEEQISIIEELDYDKLENDLREQLNQIARQQWMMTVYGMGDSYTDAMMKQGYDAVREKFDALKDGDLQKDNADLLRQLRDTENQLIMTGEFLFIGLKGGEAQRASLQRTIAKTERSVRELTLRQELGQVSEMSVAQVRSYQNEARSGEKTLEMSLGNNLLQLKAMVGVPLDQTLALGALPKVSPKQLSEMDLEADLARAKEASYALYEAGKTRDDAKKEYSDYGYIDLTRATYRQMQAVHTWRAAQYTYENTVQNFEMRFRALYAQVKDAAQVLDAKREAVEREEREYAASALKYEQGNISANALADAKDELADAKDAAAAAERDLFSKYRTYFWAAEYGILNS